MSLLKVARLGHPILRKVSEPVSPKEIGSPDFQKLIGDMIETMHEYDGVGLAAPQIHVSKQIAVIEVKKNSRYPDISDIPLAVLINPRIKARSKKSIDGWEGCLSIPDLRGVVPRSESLICEALDREGKLVKIEASGFFARAIQHECDHLEGRVYLDRMHDFTSLTHLLEFNKYHA